MGEYVLRLPEEESIVLSGAVVRRLLQTGDGDAALLYLAVLQNRGVVDDQRLPELLRWNGARVERALAALEGQGLISRPGKTAAPAGERPVPQPPQREQRPEYTREDMARALENPEFAGLRAAVEGKLGKKLTTPDTAILLGLYNDVGMPADVIFSLVGFCTERVTAQYGPGRRPTMRQIEREGYAWARRGIMDQQKASDYNRSYQQARQALPRLMRLLRLGDRSPAPSEEKYLRAWLEMGFEDAAVELAYDKTILKCKDLKWPYMNKILTSWHQKGLHTLDEVRREDRPAPAADPAGEGKQNTIRADMERMEKYRRQMGKTREKEGK